LILGVYKRFTGISWDFANELGDSEAGNPLAEGPDQGWADCFGESEMGCPFDPVMFMEIIGDYPGIDEGFGEGKERFYVVVDSFEEDRLV